MLSVSYVALATSARMLPQEHRKLKDVSMLEMLTTTPKQRRLKQYRLPR